ncbi:hypothetical protein BaRGS_00035604, partial [Batillaria attramentaria]
KAPETPVLLRGESDLVLEAVRVVVTTATGGLPEGRPYTLVIPLRVPAPTQLTGLCRKHIDVSEAKCTRGWNWAFQLAHSAQAKINGPAVADELTALHYRSYYRSRTREPRFDAEARARLGLGLRLPDDVYVGGGLPREKLMRDEVSRVTIQPHRKGKSYVNGNPVPASIFPVVGREAFSSRGGRIDSSIPTVFIGSPETVAWSGKDTSSHTVGSELISRGFNQRETDEKPVCLFLAFQHRRIRFFFLAVRGTGK